MRIRRLLSRIFIATGVILLAFWALARVDSHVASRSALAEAGAVMALPADRIASPDTSLWSEGRIAKFRDSLRLSGDPPIAILRIPRLKIETPVFRGTDALTLNRGAGWVTGTAVPGTNGNSAIAGHRDGFFRPLKDIAVDDAIELRTRGGTRTFVVREILIVRPANVAVLRPSREPTLTLITCYPFYFAGSAPKRFIVRAVATARP